MTYRRDKCGNICERIDRALGKVVLVENLAAVTGTLSVPYAIIGGHAVTIHGHPRTTADIDLLVRPADVDKTIEQLGGSDATPLTIGGKSVKIDGTDVDVVAPDQPWVDDAVATAVQTKYGRVVSKPYLVVLKLWASRGEQDDTDIIYTIRGMSAAEVAETKKLVKKWLPNQEDDVNSMIEIAKSGLQA